MLCVGRDQVPQRFRERGWKATEEGKGDPIWPQVEERTLLSKVAKKGMYGWNSSAASS